jgi:hypothetical protein
LYQGGRKAFYFPTGRHCPGKILGGFLQSEAFQEEGEKNLFD